MFRFFHSNIGATLHFIFVAWCRLASACVASVQPQPLGAKVASSAPERLVASPGPPVSNQVTLTRSATETKNGTFLKTFFLILLLGAWISAVQGGTVNVSGVRRILKQSEVFLGISLLGSFRS